MKSPLRFIVPLALLLASAPAALFAAKPFAPLDYTPQGNLGQALVDMEMARHPELKLITLHVTPAGVPATTDAERCILCSSIGRIGKHDNDEDIGVFQKGEEKTELATEVAKGVSPWSVTQAPKYEFMAPIVTAGGEKVGLAVIVFGYRAGDDTAKFNRIGREICDDIRQRIRTKDDLLAPAR